MALFLLMPLLAVMPVSLTPARMLAMPTGELSLRHYRALIEDPRWLRRDPALDPHRPRQQRHLDRAGAVPSASASGCSSRASRPLLVGFVLLPMVVPPVVSAITLYFLLTSLSG